MSINYFKPDFYFYFFVAVLRASFENEHSYVILCFFRLIELLDIL